MYLVDPRPATLIKWMSQLLIILVYYSFPSLYLKCYKFLVILFEQKPGLILRLLNYNTPFIIAVLEVYTCYQGEDNKKIYRWTFIFRTCTVNYNKKMFVNSDVSYSWFYNCTEVKNLLILEKKNLMIQWKPDCKSCPQKQKN